MFINDKFYFQAISLPKLPVPQLMKTMEKYEKTLRPLLDESEQKNIKIMIEDFCNGLGPKLQLYLLEKQKICDNWVSRKELLK